MNKIMCRRPEPQHLGHKLGQATHHRWALQKRRGGKNLQLHRLGKASRERLFGVALTQRMGRSLMHENREQKLLGRDVSGRRNRSEPP